MDNPPRRQSESPSESPNKKPKPGPLSTALCCQCQEKPAEQFCICSFPPSFFCPSCCEKHKSNASEDVHYFLPSSEAGKIQQGGDCVRAQCKLVSIRGGVKALNQSLELVQKCASELEENYTTLIKTLQSRKEAQLRELTDLKDRLRDEIRTAAETAKNHLFDKDYVPDVEVTKILWKYTYATDPEDLKLFAYLLTVQKPALDEAITAKFIYKTPLSCINDRPLRPDPVKLALDPSVKTPSKDPVPMVMQPKFPIEKRGIPQFTAPAGTNIRTGETGKKCENCRNEMGSLLGVVLGTLNSNKIYCSQKCELSDRPFQTKGK